jgi:hypothetical protein
LPLFNSFMTALQSISPAAYAGRALAANTIVATSIAEAAATAVSLITIFLLGISPFLRDSHHIQNLLRIKRSGSAPSDTIPQARAR